MSEKRRYVEILNYQVTMTCDDCEKGAMEYIKGNTCIATDPPRYAHRCTLCGRTETFTKQYPYIEQRVLHIPQI